MKRFILLASGLCILVSSSAHALIDTDLDDLSDIWEQQHAFTVGDNPPVSEAPDADPDGDGFINLSESRAGTDPYDQNSFPSLAFSLIPPIYETSPPSESAPPVLIDPPVSILTWPTVPGKTYEAIPSEDLVDWSSTTGSYIGSGTPLTFESETLYADGGVPPEFFWRVEINDTGTITITPTPRCRPARSSTPSTASPPRHIPQALSMTGNSTTTPSSAAAPS